MGDFLVNQAKKDNFVKWAELKSEIHFTRNIKEMCFQTREIWWASLGVNIGHEEDGKNVSFERPVLIIRRFNKFIALVVPLSSRLKNSNYYYHFSFDNKLRSAIISQIRLISSKRLIRRIGRLNRVLFNGITTEIKNCF